MKPIQSLCTASLFVAAFVLASPGIADAQDSSHTNPRAIDHQQVDHPLQTRVSDPSRHIDHPQVSGEAVDHQQPDRQVTTVQKVGRHRVVTTTQTRTRHGVVTRTRTTRTRALCDDGTWSYTSCVDHGGLASRQYTPRASDVAVMHANEHSAVARAYANRVRATAVARCNDGTYWHATNHVRACYAHGGVARWY